METKVYNLLILDESGSMQSIKKEAIDGINEVLQSSRAAQNKHPEQSHRLTLVAFNSAETRAIYDNIEVGKAEDVTAAQYSPSCCTPLYDAMGFSLTKLEKNVEKDAKVLITVITDGLENSSREYNGSSIKALVECLKAKGWVFTYIGANQDSERAAGSVGISNSLDFTATRRGTHKMFKKLAKSRARWFDTLANGVVAKDNFFHDDEE